MSLVVSQSELIGQLDIYTNYMVSTGYQIGLYQSNTTPLTNGDVIGNYTLANFSGYSGYQLLVGPSAAAWVTPRAVSNFTRRTWTVAAGGISNNIYGYVVITGAGILAWAERLTGGPALMSVIGQTYSVDPQFTRRSEF